MEIIKENNDIILLYNKVEIERYNFTKNIDFNGLVNFLLTNNLQTKYTIAKEFKDKTPEEEGLVQLVKKILDDYNDKIDDYNKFIEDERQENN